VSVRRATVSFPVLHLCSDISLNSRTCISFAKTPKSMSAGRGSGESGEKRKGRREEGEGRGEEGVSLP